MRDHNKYYYVEVALRKDHHAIQNMAADAERRDVPLSALVKEACINAYDESSEKPRMVPVKPKDDTSVSVLEQSISSANDFLDSM